MSREGGSDDSEYDIPVVWSSSGGGRPTLRSTQPAYPNPADPARLLTQPQGDPARRSPQPGSLVQPQGDPASRSPQPGSQNDPGRWLPRSGDLPPTPPKEKTFHALHTAFARRLFHTTGPDLDAGGSDRRR